MYDRISTNRNSFKKLTMFFARDFLLKKRPLRIAHRDPLGKKLIWPPHKNLFIHYFQ
jgi:hypothetical protein